MAASSCSRSLKSRVHSSVRTDVLHASYDGNSPRAGGVADPWQIRCGQSGAWREKLGTEAKHANGIVITYQCENNRQNFTGIFEDRVGSFVRVKGRKSHEIYIYVTTAPPEQTPDSNVAEGRCVVGILNGKGDGSHL